MAKINFNDVNFGGEGTSTSVGFFTLKNDKDSAIVRIMHDSVEDFEILTVHNMPIEGKFRNINCLRGPHDPLNMCPFCKEGKDVRQKIFIKLLQYTKDENGNVVCEPKIWERSISYATKLKNMITEYGPLSQCIFKITRNGAPKSMETTYDIMFANPQVYRNDLYPIKENAFKDFSVVGTMVMDKTFEDIQSFIVNGKFPSKDSNEVVSKDQGITPKDYVNTAPVYSTDTKITTIKEPTTSAPWETPQRPVRHY